MALWPILAGLLGGLDILGCLFLLERWRTRRYAHRRATLYLNQRPVPHHQFFEDHEGEHAFAQRVVDRVRDLERLGYHDVAFELCDFIYQEAALHPAKRTWQQARLRILAMESELTDIRVRDRNRSTYNEETTG